MEGTGNAIESIEIGMEEKEKGMTQGLQVPNEDLGKEVVVLGMTRDAKPALQEERMEHERGIVKVETARREVARSGQGGRRMILKKVDHSCTMVEWKPDTFCMH